MNKFESRQGIVNYKEEVIYNFLTDIRNFDRFIPAETVKHWHATADSCSFEVPYAGKTGFSIRNKTPFSEVDYAGQGMNTEFSLKILIHKEGEDKAGIKVFMLADLNPILKMMVAKPLEQFLTKLMDEMEKFDGWEDIKE